MPATRSSSPEGPALQLLNHPARRLPSGLGALSYNPGVTTTRPQKIGELRSTISGVENEPLYSPANVDVEYERDLGDPGRFPFTRGVYESMYRGRLWTMRQFAGFGTAEDTNERFRYLF